SRGRAGRGGRDRSARGGVGRVRREAGAGALPAHLAPAREGRYFGRALQRERRAGGTDRRQDRGDHWHFGSEETRRGAALIEPAGLEARNLGRGKRRLAVL